MTDAAMIDTHLPHNDQEANAMIGNEDNKIEINDDQRDDEFMTLDLEQPDSEPVINYKIWKKNALFLYDYIQTSNLVWPSLTIQWFPDIDYISDNIIQERLLAASHSSGNATVESLNVLGFKRLKDLTKVVDLNDYSLVKNEFINTTYTNPNPNNKNNLGKISIMQRLPHRHESNKSRYMPQNPDVIGSITSDGSVRVYNRTRHPNNFNDDEFNGLNEDDLSDLKLEFHKSEGYGLSWNFLKEGQLCSGASDGLIAFWDLTKCKQSMTPIKISTKITTSVNITPTTYTPAHDFGVNDIEFLWCHDSILGSVGEDSKFKLWDIRENIKETKSYSLNSNIGINSLSWNKQNQFCVALGDSGGKISINDIRNFDEPIKTFESAHQEGITSLEWNYKNKDLLASASSDGKAKLWDISRENGQELIFVHGGHMLGINDISWSLADPMMLATCSDDNSVHVWKPSQQIISRI